jgi:DNA-binding CsgD family transcriptional regulator
LRNLSEGNHDPLLAASFKWRRFVPVGILGEGRGLPCEQLYASGICDVVTVDEFSRLVSGLYRSAVSPDELVPALDDIRCAAGAIGGGLSFADGMSRRLVNVHVPAEAMASYGAYYHQIDYVVRAVETGPVGLVRSGAELVGLAAGTEFDVDWMRRYDMNDGLFVRLTDGATPTCLILAAPKRSALFNTPERTALVDALVPHLQLSLRTGSHVRDLVDRHDDLEPALDLHRHGIVVLGAENAVVHLNSAARSILRSSDGLQLRSGGVEATRPAANVALRAAVARAFARRNGDPWGGSFCCARPSGRRPYVVHVLAVRHAADTSPRTRRAILAIVDPELDPEPPVALLRRLWGLTAMEADVATRIAGGADPHRIADELSISIATVRKHLQHVYDKTDTHRQAELVRLLLALRP